MFLIMKIEKTLKVVLTCGLHIENFNNRIWLKSEFYLMSRCNFYVLITFIAQPDATELLGPLQIIIIMELI